MLTELIGEGHFDDGNKLASAGAGASGAATPAEDGPPAKKKRGMSKKAKSRQEKLAIIDGTA